MKKGDLVRPMGSCGGPPGAVRCNLALVIEANEEPLDDVWVKARCPCGPMEDYSWHFEKIGSDPEVSYSADPM